MADANFNRYSSYSPEMRRESALEMAQEIAEHNARLFALSSALLGQLTPGNGEEPVDYQSLLLAELLNELMADTGQQNRLIQCLSAMQSEEVCHA